MYSRRVQRTGLTGMDGSRGLIDLELSDAHGRKGLLADVHCVWHGNMNADTQDRTGDNCARSAAARLLLLLLLLLPLCTDTHVVKIRLDNACRWH